MERYYELEKNEFYIIHKADGADRYSVRRWKRETPVLFMELANTGQWLVGDTSVDGEFEDAIKEACFNIRQRHGEEDNRSFILANAYEEFLRLPEYEPGS